MTNFKVGQKVVCVKPSPGFLIKGETYTITDIKECKCGKTQVSWGLKHLSGEYISCPCCKSHSKISNAEWYAYASRFEPVKEQYNSANQEILQKFPLTEEKADVKVKEVPVKQDCE